MTLNRPASPPGDGNQGLPDPIVSRRPATERKRNLDCRCCWSYGNCAKSVTGRVARAAIAHGFQGIRGNVG